MGEEKGVHPTSSEKEWYWVPAASDSLGILVAAAWMLSKPKNLQKHRDLYGSCGWDSLVAHPKLLFLWVPKWARALAIRILDMLVQEVKGRPRPIVFAAFSGGFKSCLYQLFDILGESYERIDSPLSKYRIVRDCYAGIIHDSSPVDFISFNGANFASHPTVLGSKERSAALTWLAHGFAKGLDLFLLHNFERQRAEMWSIAYGTGAWGPVLILCSKDDDLAPFEVNQRYSSRLESLGCKVTMIVWENSPHVGHLKTHPDEYRSAVAAFLADAAALFKYKTDDNAHHDGGDGSIGRCVTSSSVNCGQKVVPQYQKKLSIRPPSQVPGDNRVRVWIPARM